MANQTIKHDIKAESRIDLPGLTLKSMEANIASEHYFTAHDGVLCVLASTDGDSRCDVDDEGRLIWGDVLSDIPKQLEFLTFCVLVLQNGLIATGESLCTDPENFDPEIERGAARAKAVNKIFSSMNRVLSSRLHAICQDSE